MDDSSLFLWLRVNNCVVELWMRSHGESKQVWLSLANTNLESLVLLLIGLVPSVRI